ncbi:MAG: DinB family protein [Chloroflexia bacterium]
MPFIINQRRTYHVYIESGSGGAISHVAELPGCFGVGSTVPLSVAATPGAITRFLAWLKSHREPLVPEAHVLRPSMVDLGISEVRDNGAPLVAGSKAALFPFDQEAWDDYKLERTLRWLGYSRADLLAKIDGLTDDDLKRRHVAPDRTLWQTLWHVADAEYGYITHVIGDLLGKEAVTEDYPADIKERLRVTREIFVRYARSIPPDKRSEITYPTWSDHPDEPWTLAKAMRRAIEHELEHLAEL